MENKLNYINVPKEIPKNVTHNTFYSKLVEQEIGYNIYLPPNYEKNTKRYSVLYHLHGWKGNESSDIWALEKLYKNNETITVFANGTDNGFLNYELPMESIVINELIPHIDEKYKTDTTRESRSISGFSMGGGGAFYYAIKYLQLFGSVIAYAGTYHHFLHKDYCGIGKPPEKIIEIYEKIMVEKKYFENENIYFDKKNILLMIKENAQNIRNNIKIKIHIGNNDILYCENEILHLYLNSLNINHEYKVFDGIEHELDKIIF